MLYDLLDHIRKGRDKKAIALIKTALKRDKAYCIHGLQTAIETGNLKVLEYYLVCTIVKTQLSDIISKIMPFAVSMNNAEVVNMLRRNGVSVNTPDDEGRLALIYAIDNDMTEMTDLLLNSSAFEYDLHAPDRNKQASRLYNYKADLLKCDKQGRNGISAALDKGSKELIDHIIKISHCSYTIIFGLKYQLGEEAAVSLIEQLIDPIIATGELDPDRAIEEALAYTNDHMIGILLGKGVVPSEDTQHKAMCDAAQKGNLTRMKMLKETGKGMNPITLGYVLWEIVLNTDKFDVVEWLVQTGAELNTKRAARGMYIDHAETIMERASRNNTAIRTDIVRLLLHHGQIPVVNS